VTGEVDRALVILLSSHSGGEVIRYSELFPVLRRYGLTVGRTVEVLDHLGLFQDDRTPRFESYLDRVLADLAAGIRRDVEHWLRALHDGGPRSRGRDIATIQGYVRSVRPVLLAWSTRYDHLREVTRDDIVMSIGCLTGSKHHHTLTALRSLFRHCSTIGTIFRNPTARIRVGRQNYGLIVPLEAKEISPPSPRRPHPPRVSRSSWPPSTPPAPRRSARLSSTTSTSATADSPSTAASDRSTSSRTNA